MVGLLASAGCESPDTRISVDEFLAMQEGRSFDANTATTQPAADPSTPQQIAAWVGGPKRIGAGDVISVTMSGLEALGLKGTYELRVEDDGTILLDTIGEVRVAGLTLGDAERMLHDAYVPKFIKETQVTVEVISHSTVSVVVLGEVRQPVPVELRRDQSSVLHAILAAGGPTESANGDVTVLKAADPENPLKFDMKQRAELARAATPGLVDNADIVIVERGASDYIFIHGLVNTPGPIGVRAGTTISVMQAIAAAGGTLRSFAPREATLMRRKSTGELVRVKLDLHRLSRGEDPDLALAPGDIVLVPHTVDTRFEEWLAKTLYFRAGVDGTFNPWTFYFFEKDFDLRERELDSRDVFGTEARFGGFGTPIGPAPPAQ